jgi:acetyl esterase/lipase
VITTGTGRWRWLRRLGVLGVLAVAAAGCDLADIPGDGPLRYRDEIFASTTKTADITYGSAVDQQGQTVTLKLDVYRPAGDTVTKRPIVIWVHGGSFRGGDKTSPELVDEATTFARKGYVTASINYRLSSTGCGGSAPVAQCVTAINQAREDAQAAVRFFRAHPGTYGVDPTRIAIGGSSAGAITALNVGYQPDHPGSSGNPGFSSAVGGALSLSGAVIFTGEVGPGDAPALLFHGTEDALVPYQWAVDTVDAAHDDGLRAYLITWEGAGHVPYSGHRDEILHLSTNFVYRTLDAGNAAR